jgi:hypothetical protein
MDTSLRSRTTAVWATLALIGSSATLAATIATASPAEASGSSRTIHASGTVNLRDSASGLGKPVVQSPEFSKNLENEQDDADAHAAKPAPTAPSAGVTHRKPGVQKTWQGLNLFDQRYANNGNQFTVEPPDQSLCVGNGYVVEAVNTVLRVYGTNGAPKTGVIDLNTFFGYPAEYNRTTGRYGPSITDPVCHFDPQTRRFYQVVSTSEVDPVSGNYTGANTLDLAVSRTANPTGAWKIYRIPVQNDASQGTPNHHCAPGSPPSAAAHPTACFGDYPHLGLDAHGLYITTNEYDFFGPNFRGAQIYALSKRALARGDASVHMVQIDTAAGTANTLGGEPGFTVWPAISPGTHQYAKARGGTEFFMSSNAAEEAKGEDFGSSNTIGLWALTNTSSLDSDSPSLVLDNGLSPVKRYTTPPKADQKPGPFPLGQCINDTSIETPYGKGCWNYFFTDEPAHNEVLSHPDANDTRMQQVVYTRGTLIGSLDTGVRVGGELKAGVEWFMTMPWVTDSGVRGQVRSGYQAVANNNLSYPTVGALADGKGTLSYSLMGENHYPSMAFSRLDVRSGVEKHVRIVADGKAPDDGFTSYKAFVGDPPRTRWGDYGAAAMLNGSIWFAGEWIASRCTLGEYVQDFTCGGTRAPLGNWSTSITHYKP